MRNYRCLAAIVILAISPGLCGCAFLDDVPRKSTTFFVFNPGDTFGEGVGLGVGHYHYGPESMGFFAEGKAFFSGNVAGVEYHSAPGGSGDDPVTGEERNGASFNGGLTMMPTDKIVLYGGGGFGFRSSRQERFDASSTLSADGYYHFSQGSDLEASFVIGGLYLFEDWTLQLGYDLWDEAGKIGFGLEW